MNYREIFYISNLLTLSRIVLVIPMYHFLVLNTPSASYWAAFFMIVAALTDSFDGRLARRWNQQTDFGRILDPVADKIAVAIVAFLLVPLRGLPLWFLILVIVRDLGILLMGLIVIRRKNVVAESLTIGKVTVTALGALIIIFTLDISVLKQAAIWLNVSLLIVSSGVYFLRFKELLRSAN